MQSSTSSAEPPTQEYTLRAMATNYAGGHSWDHLDGEACTKAADEIARLRAGDGYRAAWLDLIERCNVLKEENYQLPGEDYDFAIGHLNNALADIDISAYNAAKWRIRKAIAVLAAPQPRADASAAPQLREAVAAAHAAFEAIPIGYPLQQNGRTIDHTLLNEAKRLCEQAVSLLSTDETGD